MNIGNITNTLFPADWDPTDFTSPGTQAVAVTVAITAIALAALACQTRNRTTTPAPAVNAPASKDRSGVPPTAASPLSTGASAGAAASAATPSHTIAITSEDNGLAIVISGDQATIPRSILKQANAAISGWRTPWETEISDGTKLKFTATSVWKEGYLIFELKAERSPALSNANQVIELMYLKSVTVDNIPSKTRLAPSLSPRRVPGGGRTLPIGGGTRPRTSSPGASAPDLTRRKPDTPT